MSDFFSDPCLAVASRPAQSVVGLRAGSITLSHSAFMQRIGAWSHAFQHLPGKQLALYLNDSLEFAAALLAAWQCGKTVWLNADTLNSSCAAMAKSVDAFAGDFPAEFQPLQASPAPVHLPPLTGLDPEFLGLVVHTSGSTGQAQAVPKKISQLTSEVANLEEVFGARLENAVVLATVSHQHIYGLLFRILWPLAAGRVIHAESLSFPEQLLQLAGQADCVLIASPAHLKRLPDHLDWQAARQHLRAVFSSGGPLTAEVAFSVGKLLGQVPLEVYGSSETGGIAWRQRKQGNIDTWQALPGVAWRIHQEDGLLEVRSPHLMQDAWLRLTDRGQMTEDGHLLLLGRSDRIVKIEEKRISLDAMEQALLSSELVNEVRILVDEEVAGQRQKLTAFVVPSALGHDLLAQTDKNTFNQRLRALLSGVVDAIALPRRWRYLDQMPVNAQGKTTHAQLLALINENQDQRPRLPQVHMLEQEATRVVLELTVPASLFYFDGHFAIAPVLPGVVQVDWAILYGRQYFDLPAIFISIHALKFQQVIHAETPVMLEMIHDLHKGSVQFRYFSDAGQHASGRILFTNEKTAC
ncbi:AMP-binding protein [Undibacterium sp. Ji50W]|uniref:AMP-binding protein n=1 Tax=Undibacterium sp. Ji50W TaxID=3413041 RepID=UPI003BEFE2B9